MFYRMVYRVLCAGHLNKMMVDTDAITKVFMGWWNYENDLLKDLISADVAFVDNINQVHIRP